MYAPSNPSNKRKLEQDPTTVVKKQRVDQEASIKVCTWNIGHLSNTSDRRIEKLKNISSLLKSVQPDLLVLQELNQDLLEFNDIERFWTELSELKYAYHSGPCLKADDSQYVKKTGTQYEYYAVFYSLSKIQILETSTILNKSFYEFEFVNIKEEKQLVSWVTDRPVVLRKIKTTKPQYEFYLGVVHTSPSFDVARTSRGYIWGTQKKLGNNTPWILAGDWYVKDDKEITVASGQKQKWSDFLKAIDCKLVKPNNYPKTNFPNTGEGMIADYFVTSSHFESEKIAAFFRAANQSQEGTPPQRYSPVQTWMSDHIPVCASFKPVVRASQYSIEAENLNQNIFPYRESRLAISQSHEPILLNGMKVIFDQPVGVYPVTLESKEEKRV